MCSYLGGRRETGVFSSSQATKINIINSRIKKWSQTKKFNNLSRRFLALCRYLENSSNLCLIIPMNRVGDIFLF